MFAAVKLASHSIHPLEKGAKPLRVNRHRQTCLSTRISRLRGVVIFAFVAAAVLLLSQAQVFAHAYLVKSIPAQRAVLLRAPAKIQLWFNERLEARYSTLTLVNANGKNVAFKQLEIGGDDPKRISATVDALSVGKYVVKYRVLSVDGHIAENQFPFTIKQ